MLFFWYSTICAFSIFLVVSEVISNPLGPILELTVNQLAKLDDVKNVVSDGEVTEPREIEVHELITSYVTAIENILSML